jgi:hypothetical protein
MRVVERNGRKELATIIRVCVCENLWHAYQQEAEEIVAPGGVLIADPKERNRAINAAYARLWLHDNRFQWAGLAAFASKQVGCGLLHASQSIEKIQAEHEAAQRLANSPAEQSWGIPGVFTISKTDEQAARDLDQARRNNPVPSADIRLGGEELSLMQQQYQHVYEMMAMGNTSLFLDVFPLHAFYAKRGLQELKKCLPLRKNLVGYTESYSPLWPVGQDKLEFGEDYKEIIQAFEAIDAGDVAESVKSLATHEQVNILQPAIYSDQQLVRLLRGNHFSFVTGFPRGAAEAIELTLASQCRRADGGRTVSFGNYPFANLAVIEQRMAFVFKAAAQFDDLLKGDKREQITQSIQDIAEGRGIR